ncbi:MAG: DEAD/DEAH box helicase family protein [Clostridia bacterium]|nr:DEAD/DEAH box helicase family protein [Clostridia bacterium]
MKDFSKVRFKWTFRDYQQTVLDNSQKHLKDKRIHIVAAPGSGKTILGLELIRRQNSPALIMSPSVTIRQQWGERFVEAYLPDGENPDDYISYNLFAPSLMTSVTYQALHAASTRSQITVSDDDDELYQEQSLDFTDFDLIAEIKKAGIRTICLDEAHHLKSEWQKALEKFIEALSGDVTVIALTATPPYDSTPAEWNRYTSLCGEIDEEIFVPQLVCQKTLCPHQDYIYFSYPSEEEAQILDSYKKKALLCTDAILKSSVIRDALTASRVTSDDELLYDNLHGFQSLVCVAKKSGAAVSKSLEDKVFEGKKCPDYSVAHAEKAFQFIIDNPDIFGEGLSEKLRSELSCNALIEKRKVRLSSNDKINKMLVSSVKKLDSICRIVDSEHSCLSQSLRMLILTDYIKKDMMKLVGTDEDIHAIGTVPVFEMIRRSCNKDIKTALLSGSLVIIPDSAVEAAQSVAYESSVPCRIRKIENTDHTEIIFSGSNKNKVSIITKVFQAGFINILIGTKSLLGEGWDSPNINSLILASFVGSFMLSNQMRGRAIRIDKTNPQKVSSIWHLVTVDPESKDSLTGDDFDTMKRRFACFMAPAYNSDVIESGIDRLDILKPPFDENGIADINKKMLSLSADRDTVATRWNASVRGNARPETVEISEIPATVHPKKAVFKNKIYAIILAVLVVLSIIIIATTGFFGSLLGVIITVFSSVLMIKTASYALKNSSPEKTVQNIASSVLRSLKETGKIDSRSPKIYVTVTRNGNVSCSLQNATVREKNVFATAISELLSPIEDPRYLLIGTNGLFKIRFTNYAESYACPSILAVNKETADILSKNLRSTGGRYELVFTRNEQGRKELFKCRKLSYVNLNGKAVKNKKTVR